MIDDSVLENDEIFNLIIVDSSSNNFERGELRKIKVTIVDDEGWYIYRFFIHFINKLMFYYNKLLLIYTLPYYCYYEYAVIE